ncbi:aspartate/glutamate racemase family protein [Candidatus Formimonas warabiya]|uniref:Hydantoin racemase n=1 Tax=Formimonas warabiya TaxID=1761012 RepID=A0A3G1KRE8_FORW1|nr:aspartate/glutamate racemase family protein [Candidatus Formimonas warabiya]ATW25016.1 hydantoin racemase [Candidatus Formimonas warabiya]
MKKKKILFINPVGHETWDADVKNYLTAYKEDATEVDVVSLKKGPHHLEYHYYEALIAGELLHTIKEAEKKGYDGAVIGCFYDPFLREAREICTRMVVTAPAESSLQLAALYGDTFSIMVGRKKWIPAMHRNVRLYGYGEKLASFRSLDMGVLDFHQNESYTENLLITEGRKAITEDRAEVLILGCTVQFGFYRELQKVLGVPVIDAVLAPFKHAEYLVALREGLGWITSKVGGFETPPLREIKEWKLEDQYRVPDLWE